ncbi:PspC domain-containing protein [Chitinophaga lutea]
MKKIININLSSRLIPIEDSAYEMLRQYLDSLRRYFSQEEGADEIVGDIESRIAEVFQDKIRKGAHCITDEDVQAIKTSMGTPEQFAEEPVNSQQKAAGSSSQSAGPEAFAPYVRPRKRFYRDTDNKVLGGVCSGLGAYFNVDPIVFRIVFALMAVGLWGGGILLYFILWFATPEAVTAAEKLEMRGERVDLNNIKATVQEEMNAFRSRMDRVGEDMRNFSEGRGKQFGRDAGSAIEAFFRGLGKAIAYLAKGFFVFLAVVLLFVTVVGLIVAASFSAVLFPIKDLIFDTGIQSALFWPALTLLLGIPILALLLFVIRKMAGIRNYNKYSGYTLGFLWLVGIGLTLWLTISVARDFSNDRPRTPVKETVSIQQPSGDRLVLRKGEDVMEMDDQDFLEGRIRVVDDTVIVGNVTVNLKRSQTDQFVVEVQRSSRGRTYAQADKLARQIQFQLQQQDSVLTIPSGFSIPRNSIYRLQWVTISIYVPVGKTVVLEPDARRYFNFGSRHRNDWWDDYGRNWNDDEEIDVKMNADGWERREKPAEPAASEKDREKAHKDSVYQHYRYEQAPVKEENKTPIEDSGKTKPAATRSGAALQLVAFLFQAPFSKAE